MDVAAIATALIGAQASEQRTGIAMALLRMNADAASSMANMLADATQSTNSLANVAGGIGANLNISV